MKIKFKLIGAETETWATLDNNYSMGSMPTMQANKTTMKFVSVDNSINVDITLDERHSLAQQMVMGMQNEIFEFDFAQPLPERRLNG